MKAFTEFLDDLIFGGFSEMNLKDKVFIVLITLLAAFSLVVAPVKMLVAILTR